MKQENDIRDDEIRIIGAETPKNASPKKKIYWVVSVFGIIIIALSLYFLIGDNTASRGEKHDKTSVVVEVLPEDIKNEGQASEKKEAYTEIQDTVVNDIPMKLYTPRNAAARLHLGKLEKEGVILAVRAADVREDNSQILGSFVISGKIIVSGGGNKRGYCAIIKDSLIIGVAEDSPLFESAASSGGDFFRQYPLVDNGELIINKPRGKAIRRALCQKAGEPIFIVETQTRESFLDFSQVLVDMNIQNAIYIVGSDAHGWAKQQNGEIREIGQDTEDYPEDVNYLVWE